jgi:hypothetical protein
MCSAQIVRAQPFVPASVPVHVHSAPSVGALPFGEFVMHCQQML